MEEVKKARDVKWCDYNKCLLAGGEQSTEKYYT